MLNLLAWILISTCQLKHECESNFWQNSKRKLKIWLKVHKKSWHQKAKRINLFYCQCIDTHTWGLNFILSLSILNKHPLMLNLGLCMRPVFACINSFRSWTCWLFEGEKIFQCDKNFKCNTSRKFWIKRIFICTWNRSEFYVGKLKCHFSNYLFLSRKLENIFSTLWFLGCYSWFIVLR